MTEIKLDSSWEEKSNELFYPDADIDFASYKGFLDGAQSFQKRAIEQLEKEAELAYNAQSKHYLGLKLVIDIIKNLKAE